MNKRRESEAAGRHVVMKKSPEVPAPDPIRLQEGEPGILKINDIVNEVNLSLEII